MKWQTSSHGLRLSTNEVKYLLHLDQKASQADVCNIQVLQVKKHNFQDCRREYKSSRHNKNPKQARESHLDVTAFLLITYIYIERVSLDTQ